MKNVSIILLSLLTIISICSCKNTISTSSKEIESRWELGPNEDSLCRLTLYKNNDFYMRLVNISNTKNKIHKFYGKWNESTSNILVLQYTSGDDPQINIDDEFYKRGDYGDTMKLIDNKTIMFKQIQGKKYKRINYFGSYLDKLPSNKNFSINFPEINLD